MIRADTGMSGPHSASVITRADCCAECSPLYRTGRVGTGVNSRLHCPAER